VLGAIGFYLTVILLMISIIALVFFLVTLAGK
jgi:hypothetical protein